MTNYVALDINGMDMFMSRFDIYTSVHIIILI